MNVPRGIERILLVDVESGNSGQLAGRWSHHPLGLMYLAAAARRSYPQIEVRIFHTVTVPDPDRHLASLLADFKPQIVGLRALSIARANFSRTAGIVRSVLPEALLVGGGPHPSASFEDILREGEVDLAVIGEGERTFVELIGASMTDPERVPQRIAGTAVLRDGQVVRNPARELISDLNSIAPAAYDLVNLRDYAGISNHAFQQADECAFIESSRGCPYRCQYCHVARVKSVRNRSPESVVDEIQALHEKRGIRNFVFVDDIFNVPKKNGKETLSLLIKRVPGVRVNFPNGLRADQLDLEFLDLFEAAGTTHMALAVETASPRLQKLMGKNLKLEITHEMIHEASKRFVVSGFFMIGFPTETREEAESTISYASSLTQMAQPALFFVRVYEGTILWDTLAPSPEQKKLLLEQSSKMYLQKQTEKLSFYGDFFDAEKVPLKSPDLIELRQRWVSDVLMNPRRIRSSLQVLQRHFNPEQVLIFLRNLFDREKFDQADLETLVTFASRNAS